MSLSEHELRARLIAGDESALAELYDLFGPVVYRQALRVTGDWAVAQDITQEVFVYIWAHPSRFDPERGNFRSWLGVIAHRRGVDWVRRQVVQRRREGTTTEPDVVVGPAELAITSFVHELVRRLVDALPADQRTAIRLAYFEGHTFRNVATTLGIPEGTAKSRLRSGLAALRRQLALEGLP